MDNQSFESFYRATRDDCFRALVFALGDPHEADELLAEAYTRALERWSSVREHPVPKAWILSVATNLHRDRWRRAKRSLRAWAHPETDRTSFPVDPKLTAANGALSGQQRLAVAYRVILDLDTAETARLMNVAPGTVTTHLHRALGHMRQELYDYEVTHE